MNFWQARQAALGGKRVKRVSNGYIYSPKVFLSNELDWSEPYFRDSWEIVEEPKLLYTYLNTYEDCHGQALNTKGQADAEDKGRTGCIEIITDEYGKLISVKNV